jgi:YkoY family integral membrane protein
MWGIDAAGFMALLATVATLVVLEGLLSADNALVLAVMVRHLPKVQQKRALRYGLLGAFVFRLIAVVFAATLLQYWILKVGGGLYLLYMAISHLAHGEEPGGAERRSRFGNGFWGTVVGVEVTDIAFSIDSILAAVATAEALPKRLGGIALFDLPWVNVTVDVKLLVIYIGGILGIIAMRFVAGYFLILLDRFQGLAKGAYYLVGWIGLKLLGGGLHDAVHPGFAVGPDNWRKSLPAWVHHLPLEINGWLFWAVMGLIIVASLAYKSKSPKDGPKPPPSGELVATVEKTMVDGR